MCMYMKESLPQTELFSAFCGDQLDDQMLSQTHHATASV